MNTRIILLAVLLASPAAIAAPACKQTVNNACVPVSPPSAGDMATYASPTLLNSFTPGSGVVNALKVNTGSAGAFLVNGGALGTPSSGTATNLTGLPLTSGAGVTGVLPVANGGTGTNTPGLSAGSNVTITGSWPNQTISASGGGGGYVPGVDAVAVCSGVDPTGAADSASGLNTCLTNYPAVALRAGTYKVSTTITVPSGGTLTGAGIGATTLSSTSTSTCVVSFASGAVHSTVMGLAVTHSGTPIAGGGGLCTATGVVTPSVSVSQATIRNVLSSNNYIGFSLNTTDFSICDWCIAQNNYGTGFSFLGTASGSVAPMQWSITNTLSQFNSGYGYDFNGNSSPNAIAGQTWINNSSFANSLGGFRFYNSTGSVNDIVMVNPIASSDCSDEISINSNTSGFNNQIIGGLIEYAGGIGGIYCGQSGPGSGTTPTGAGVGINVVKAADVVISGVKISFNGQFGIYQNGGSSVIINGNRIFDNSQSSSGTYSGIATATSGTYTTMTNNDFLSLSGASSPQKYNIITSSGTNNIIMGNNATTAVIGGAGCGGAGTVKPAGTAAAYNFGSSCP